MAKAAKKTRKGKKSAQVETGRLEELVGTETERREDKPAKRTVILTDTQEAGGSGRQQVGVWEVMKGHRIWILQSREQGRDLPRLEGDRGF